VSAATRRRGPGAWAAGTCQRRCAPRAALRHHPPPRRRRFGRHRRIIAPVQGQREVAFGPCSTRHRSLPSRGSRGAEPARRSGRTATGRG